MAFLDKLDFAVTVRDFDGADDGAALAHAHTLCGTHRIAITQAGRHVGEVAKGAAAEPPIVYIPETAVPLAKTPTASAYCTAHSSALAPGNCDLQL